MQADANPDETIEIMFNSTYGGFTFSDDACKLYCKEKGLDYDKAKYKLNWEVKRTDPDMIGIIKDLDRAAGCRHSDICLWKISKKYQNYFTIHEYDGTESVDIDFKGYKLDRITEAISAEPVQEDVIANIRQILAMLEEDENEECLFL